MTLEPSEQETQAGSNNQTTDFGSASSLDETLLLLNRVVWAAATSIVVTDPRLPDNPIVYHNPAFERISGYRPDEIDGHNCRFLQGPDTNPAAVEEIRSAIQEERPCHVTLLNYRKDGTSFWNDLAISPVRDLNGRLTHFVGVQNDVTLRQEAERERDALLAQQQRIAETLQRALLLTPPDTLHGIEISTQYLPAETEAGFGGDFFDVFALEDNKVALILGDVTGKGLTAAQHTAEVKYALRVLLREHGSPGPALNRLNRFLLEAQRLDDRDKNSLVGIVVALIDTDNGNALITSAGMEPPLLVRATGEAEEVAIGGVMLGIDRNVVYDEIAVSLQGDDILLMVTDGVTEARNKRKELFGYDGLIRSACEAIQRETLMEAGQEIVGKARSFAGGQQQDDICLMLARRSRP